jgi:hypothetical protein
MPRPGFSCASMYSFLTSRDSLQILPASPAESRRLNGRRNCSLPARAPTARRAPMPTRLPARARRCGRRHNQASPPEYLPDRLPPPRSIIRLPLIIVICAGMNALLQHHNPVGETWLVSGISACELFNGPKVKTQPATGIVNIFEAGPHRFDLRLLSDSAGPESPVLEQRIVAMRRFFAPSVSLCHLISGAGLRLRKV